MDDLSRIEQEMQSLWTADGATPFIAELKLPKILFESARRAAHQFSINMLLTRFPTLGVWAVLYPLAKSYVAADREIYLHLEDFLNESVRSSERSTLKVHFCQAARKIGIPIKSSTDPTKVFFAPLGAPEPQHENLAIAFVSAALHKGPPAIEDTVAARHWQRTAVETNCIGQPRLLEPIRFDKSAHYARRFDAWRRGEHSASLGEESLFNAYDVYTSKRGHKRSDFIEPPSLIWHTDSLGLVADKSSKSQSIKQGLFPTPISGGKRVSIDPPWPDTIRWSSGAMSRDVAFAPKGQDVLLFDADSGTLIQRADGATQKVEIAATRIIALSKLPFVSLSFGNAVSTVDPSVFSAWIESGETLSFQDRDDLEIVAPIDTAIWFNGYVVGRNGASALYANDLVVFMRLDANVGGAERIMRARLGNVSRFVSVTIGSKNEAQVAFNEFGFSQSTDPSRVLFEVLVPSAAGDPHARADLKAQCWIWPEVAPQAGDLSNVPVPANYDPARSAGIHVDSYDRLSVDERADAETPILGLVLEGQSYEFDLVARSEKLWHVRINKSDRVFIPKGATVNFGHDNRHDVLRLRCFDREADLIVLGALIRRPFIQRQVFEIGAEKLEVDTRDDRIAIQRVDGRIDLLARLRRVSDTAELAVEETDHTMHLTFRPSDGTEAIRVMHQTISGVDIVGDYSLGRLPTTGSRIAGITIDQDPFNASVTVTLNRADLPGPGRILFHTINGQGLVKQMKDASHAPITVGLPGKIDNPSRTNLTRLAYFLAYPEPVALGGQVAKALYPSYIDAFERVGANRTVGSIKPALNVIRADGGTVRHDIVGVAPWVFEAGPHALSGLSEGTGFSTLRLMASLQAPDPLPKLACTNPLAVWLDRINTDGDIPDGFDAPGLYAAFSDLRFRLRETDMQELCGDGVIGNSCRIICGVYAENIAKLRVFDVKGGGDPVPAKIAIQIERFARAAAQGHTEDFLLELTVRTGLSREDAGYAMTMMLRAGVRFFVYFRALWEHAITERISTQ